MASRRSRCHTAVAVTCRSDVHRGTTSASGSTSWIRSVITPTVLTPYGGVLGDRNRASTRYASRPDPSTEIAPTADRSNLSTRYSPSCTVSVKPRLDTPRNTLNPHVLPTVRTDRASHHRRLLPHQRRPPVEIHPARERPRIRHRRPVGVTDREHLQVTA